MSRAKARHLRNEQDFYATPKPAFDSLAPYLKRYSKRRIFWEPAAGDRRIVRWIRKLKFKCDGADIRDDLSYDFFNDDSFHDINITNPPFSLACGYINHSITHSNDAWLLLRMGILESENRKRWWQTRLPKAQFTLAKRPSFSEGGTDMAAYAWYYWSKKPIYRGIFVI